MNICLISQEYPPETNLGGIATYTQILGRELVKKGERVHVVTYGPNGEYTTDDMGVQVHRIPLIPKKQFNGLMKWRLKLSIGGQHPVLGFSQSVYEKILSIHQDDPIDIIEAPETCAQGLITYKLLKGVKKVTRLHVPFFWVRRLNQSPDTPENLKRDSLERKQTQCSDLVTCPTQALAKIVEEHWRIKNIRVIPNCFNLKTYVPNPQVYNDHLDRREYLLYFGRLEHRKGAHILADALVEVLHKHQTLSAVFVGNESVYNTVSIKAYIQDLLKEYKDKVIFIENIPQDSLYPIIEKSRLVVLPSLWENFPYACLEAMALGKTVIATSAGGFPEIIENGVNGILCSPNDAKALSRTILNCLDRTDLKKIEQNAHHKAGEYEAGKVASRMLDLYGSL